MRGKLVGAFGLAARPHGAARRIALLLQIVKLAIDKRDPVAHT